MCSFLIENIIYIHPIGIIISLFGIWIYHINWSVLNFDAQESVLYQHFLTIKNSLFLAMIWPLVVICGILYFLVFPVIAKFWGLFILLTNKVIKVLQVFLAGKKDRKLRYSESFPLNESSYRTSPKIKKDSER